MRKSPIGVLFSSLLLLTYLHLSLGEVFVECDGIASGEFVPSSSDCRAYLYCDGDDSMIGYCAEGQYFNPDDVDCDLEENVVCPLDVQPEYTTTITTTTTTTTTTTAATTAQATTESTTTPSTTMEPVIVPPVVRDRCPSTDDPNEIVLIPNRESCEGYYLCYHGHAIEMHCTNQLHFNTYTGKCDFPENVQCLNDRPNANKCLPHITDFFPHPDNCNYFYYCIKGFMTIQQCPFFYGWDIERRSCVQMTQAKCYNKGNSLNSFI